MDVNYLLPRKYTLNKMLGRGSYGVVCAGENTETGEKVAIKKLFQLFNNPKQTKHLLREIKLLKFFDNDYIIRMRELLNCVSLLYFEEIYIVTELMQSDL
mmetsp:Transcript_22215/g.15844  ORF Transcript_22215/g.15844 Transcript_22215/m.15844 type:complete len:100 (-) Transcript_22215:26-325(-)